MRCFLFLLAAAVSVFTQTASCFAASSDATLSIDTDLVKILDSFDDRKSRNPNDIPKLSDILEAKGTLVFFDNSRSTNQKPELGGIVKTSRSNIVERTLEKARRRLFGAERTQQPDEEPVFSSRTPEEPDWFARDAAPRTREPQFMKLDYNGAKVLAAIPPDTLIEVPFLKHIPYFFSRIEILGNGSISVTETIQRVVEPGETGFYGIDRYFGKYHADRTGEKYRTNLTVLDASIDNRPVDARLMPSLLGIRVSIHDGQPLSPGTHQFKITYLFSNKIAEFKNSESDETAPDFKELIWSVTGLHWDIPITRAGAVIIFPPDSKLYSQSAITGQPGNFAQNFNIRQDAENNLSFTLSYPLAPHEGLTVLANWSESNPAPVFQNGRLDRFMLEHGTMTVSLIAFLFVLSYYLATWSSLKKNQASKTVKAAPLQKRDLSPAVLHYALHNKISSKDLFILLLNMAAKGFLSFGEEADGTLILIKETDKETGLAPLEKRIGRRLFIKDSTSFALTPANALRLTRIMDEAEKSLKKEHRQQFTTFHQTPFLFGILMTIVSVAAVSSLSLFPVVTGLTALGCVLFIIPISIIGNKLYTALKNRPLKDNMIPVILLSVIILPFIGALLMLFSFYGLQTTLMTAVFFFITLVCIGIFYTLLRSPSMLGKSILENMEGYKLYLSSQDDTLLSTMRNADQKIKSLYGKHLPFAAAMDLDKLWTKRFAAFAEEENQLKPDWYKGKLRFDENFTEELANRFDQAFPKKNNTRAAGPSRKSRFKKS